jgi:hypothetical protein
MNANMKPLRILALLVVVGAFTALLSSQAKADSLNAGVAGVNGKVQLLASNPAAPLADFTLTPPDTGTVQTKIAFKSTRTVVQNAEIDVIGDLTLTVLEREATLNPSEDYAGPVYGERVTRNVTRQVVFVLPREMGAEPKATASASATAVIAVENFPELLPTIYAVNRPPVVEDERCEMPSNIGEDYAGPSCSGTMVVTHNVLSVSSGGTEDYRGFDSAPRAGNQVTIVLTLHLTREGSLDTAPDTAPSAGPMKVPADELQRVLGTTDVNYLVSGGSLEIVDWPFWV